MEKGTTPNTAWRTAIAVDVAQSILESPCRFAKATIALANKLARYAWAVATEDTDFKLREVSA